jgi:hypothetical protein
MLTGCEAKFQDFYPLKLSNKWIYKVTSFEGQVREVEERVIKRVGDNYYLNNKETLLLLPGQGIANKMGIMILRDPIELGDKWVENEMTLEITGLNKQVVVPAGTFADTVEITWTSMYPGDKPIAPGDQPTLTPGENPRVFIYITTYARKVGKVKEEYYIIQPDGEKSREMLAELTSYQLR